MDIKVDWIAHLQSVRQVRRTGSLTFSSMRPFQEIDYIMVRPKDRFEVIQSRVIDAPVVSDNRPVLLVVKLKQKAD